MVTLEDILKNKNDNQKFNEIKQKISIENVLDCIYKSACLNNGLLTKFSLELLKSKNKNEITYNHFKQLNETLKIFIKNNKINIILDIMDYFETPKYLHKKIENSKIRLKVKSNKTIINEINKLDVMSIAITIIQKNKDLSSFIKYCNQKELSNLLLLSCKLKNTQNTKLIINYLELDNIDYFVHFLKYDMKDIFKNYTYNNVDLKEIISLYIDIYKHQKEEQGKKHIFDKQNDNFSDNIDVIIEKLKELNPRNYIEEIERLFKNYTQNDDQISYTIKDKITKLKLNEALSDNINEKKTLKRKI